MIIANSTILYGRFEMKGLLWSCLVSLILTPFSLTKWLTQIFVDCDRFNKGEIYEVCIEWTLIQE